MDYKNLQSQYDNTYSYFRTTTEPFDFLEWDGKILCIWLNNKIIEQYSRKTIFDFVWRAANKSEAFSNSKQRLNKNPKSAKI